MTRRAAVLSMLATLVALGLLARCGGDPPQFEAVLTPVAPELTYFKDALGRYVTFKGINLGGNVKVPVVASTAEDETPQTYYGHVGDEVTARAAGEPRAFTYVGRPFSRTKADACFGQMKTLGFNAVRLIWMWEAVYPDKKYRPDRDYLAHFEELVKLAGEHGIYVLVNLHENLWSRVFYSLYSEWPVCAQCCRYDEDDHAIAPDSTVREDIVCTDERKAACCPRGDVMNMLWSLFPNRTRDELGITADDSLGVRAERYRAGFSHRVSGDGAPLWASQLCVPEKNFASPYWGVSKLLGAAREGTGPLGLELFQTLKVALEALSQGDEPTIPPDLADQIDAQLDRMEPYQPPDAFSSVDTYDGLPFTFWGLNNGFSLMTNICFGAFYAGDSLFPQRRVVEYGDAAHLDEGVESEIFYTPEEAETRAAELRAAGHTHVVVSDLRESLQSGFRGAWEEIARIGKRYPHVIGYDILNEPTGVYILMAVVQAYLDLGSPELVASLVDSLIVDEAGHPRTIGSATMGELVQQILEENVALLPPDNSDETRKRLGLYGADLMTAFGLNIDLDKKYLEPLYEYVGAAIAKVYAEGEEPANRLTFWLEPAHGIDMLLGSGGGVGGQFEQYATTPDISLPEGFAERFGAPMFVWSPHWYPDIYPFPGFNQPARIFGTDEYDFRDYRPAIEDKAGWAKFAYDNVPFVMAEFGTYWNYRCLDYEDGCNAALSVCRRAPEGFLDPVCDTAQAICPPGSRQSREMNYLVSTQILDNYYEAFEDLLASNMVWVYTPDTDPTYGDWWDHEDFSLVELIRKDAEPERFAAVAGSVPERYVVPVSEPKGLVVPRGQQAYVRPYARAISGKPISTHFYSDLHYFDPDKGTPDEVHEFEVVFASKETEAPTIVFVPELPYPDGFYVWLSDGFAVWDAEARWLYYFPQRDEPGWEHRVRIRPPLEGQDSSDWDYFIRDTQVVSGG